MDSSSVSSDKLGESPAVELTGKIMIVAVVLLFMVVVVCLFLHLYAKWCLWSNGDSTDPRRRRRRFVFAPGQDQPNHGARQRGLDPLLLRSLPILVFQSEEFKDGLECAVCLSDVVQGEKTRLLPKCNHGFHVECIDMWFQSHSTCPLCRNPIAPESSKSGTSTSNDLQNASENSESLEAGNSADMSPIFPTNVFIWGNQTQVSSNGASLEESSSQPPCSSSGTTTTTATATTSSSNSRRHGMLVIDIPSEITSSSLSPSASRFAEDDLKSPMAARLRSLKRLLSRDRRLNPFSPSSIDVEQAGGAQS